jgi:hypothetical protein
VTPVHPEKLTWGHAVFSLAASLRSLRSKVTVFNPQLSGTFSHSVFNAQKWAPKEGFLLMHLILHESPYFSTKGMRKQMHPKLLFESDSSITKQELWANTSLVQVLITADFNAISPVLVASLRACPCLPDLWRPPAVLSNFDCKPCAASVSSSVASVMLLRPFQGFPHL